MERLIYTARTNDGMQAIAKAIAEDCGGKCRQDRGVDVYGCPSMSVWLDGKEIATVKSCQNVSALAGEMT